MNKEYYGGPHAVADYLRPDATKYIPLVELPEALNPYLHEFDIHIDAKLMNTLPLGNVKSLPAWQMLQDADDSTGKHIVEASSGNTVMSLGLLAPHFGVASVKAIASPDISDGKLALLTLAGVQVELVQGPICPNPNDPNGAIAQARNQGAAPGHVNLGQYDNPSNPKAHRTVTGPQLYEQLGDALGMFCGGLGTTGTLLGTAQFLTHKLPDIKIGGVIRKSNNLVPGVRTANGLEEVSFAWKDILTEPVEEIGEKESYAASLRLIRSGLLVGPSAGFALAGTLHHLERMKCSGEIETLRGKHVVFACPDTPFPYAADYEKILGPKSFPPILNSALRQTQGSTSPVIVPEISVDTLYAQYATTSDADAMRFDPAALLVDVREPDEFNDHHLPDSLNVPLSQLPRWIKTQPDADQTRIIFICRSGNRSARATHLAKQMELDAYNLRGGTVEWSKKGLPRVKSPLCAS
jgi:cysteine synthase A